MATKKTTNSKSKKQDKKLHEQLVLNKYFLNLIGVDDLKKGLNYLKDSRLEEYSQGYSKFILEIINRDNVKLSKDKLLKYDSNIKRHTNHINQERKKESKEIKWKYFQYISILFVEIYLDMYFDDKEKLKLELNKYLVEFNKKNNTQIDCFENEDLKKLALWNATGSGKTLIMHMNILQYKYYLNLYKKAHTTGKIILLTPNEGLSNQHKEEIKKSNINANILGENIDLFNYKNNSQRSVNIIDLHKIRRKKGDKTIALESLGTDNFVLIDEGHIGLINSSSSDLSWNEIRNTLSEDGFCMEYSATFGQAIDSKNKESMNEYSKSIIFDYSYKYFYDDGYGKDYRIMNMTDVDNENEYDKFKYLVGALLTFYQQLKLYNTGNYNAFNIEEPLMIFVGSKVNAVRTEKGRNISDILEVLHFFKRFIQNSNDETKFTIKNILNGNSGINHNDIDIFKNKLYEVNKLYKIEFKSDINLLFQDMFYTLFNSQATIGTLYLDLLKNADGEISIRLSDNDPFGVINVGDSDKLLKLFEENKFDTTINTISESLFMKIKDKNSKIKFLIGSKKFTEGWDSWRVSCIGLMNIGKKEGSQIIQLFGRGIRLKGYNYKLKRASCLKSSEIGFEMPKNINILEILNIFGINADYMQEFKNMLEREEAPLNEDKELFSVPVIKNINNKDLSKLKIISIKNGLEFKKDSESIVLSYPTKYMKENKIILDLYRNVEEISSISKKDISPIKKDVVYFDNCKISVMNFDKIFFDIISYKKDRKFYNINITKDIIKELLLDNSWYEILIPREEFVLNFDNISRYEEIAIILIEKYIEKFFKKSRLDWEKDKIEFVDLTEEKCFTFDNYFIEVNRNEIDIIQNIENIINDIDNLTLSRYEDYGDKSLNFIGFDRHLYNPLIYKASNRKDIKVTPVALNEGESYFVNSIKKYYELNKNGILKDKELYLMRNMIKQVGFFEEGYFYPDFIMWLICDDKEYITFIDPKGLMHTSIHSEKVKLCKEIKKYQEILNKKISSKYIILNSFILSVTSKDELKNKYYDLDDIDFEEKNILFIDKFDDDISFIDTIINKILSCE